MKGRKTWQPCRDCGVTHQNPVSSSLCSHCGSALYLKRIADKKQLEKESEWYAESDALTHLRVECGFTMTDAKNFVKAFKYMKDVYL